MIRRIAVAAVVVFAVHWGAWANAGTALIWAKMYHLIFANFVLGVAEGLLLAAVFHLKPLPSVGALIAANYASYFAGAGLLSGSLAEHLPITLDNASAVLGGLFAAFYVLTLVVEFPFIAFVFARARRGWGKAVLGTLLVQTLSYAILAALYEGAVRDELIARGAVVGLEHMPIANDVVLYYLDENSDQIYRQRLGGAREAVAEVEAPGVQAMIASLRDEHFFGGLAPRLGDAAESAWEFYADSWGYLRANKAGQDHLWGVETPFFSGRCASPRICRTTRWCFSLAPR